MSRYGYFPTPFFAAKLEKIKKTNGLVCLKNL
jgi:hypothetical protein